MMARHFFPYRVTEKVLSQLSREDLEKYALGVSASFSQMILVAHENMPLAISAVLIGAGHTVPEDATQEEWDRILEIGADLKNRVQEALKLMN